MNKKLYFFAGAYALVVLLFAHLYARFDIAQREKFIRAETLMDEHIRIFSTCQESGEVDKMVLADEMAFLIVNERDHHVMVVSTRCMLEW